MLPIDGSMYSDLCGSSRACLLDGRNKVDRRADKGAKGTKNRTDIHNQPAQYALVLRARFHYFGFDN